jgi:hypothetical protein
MTRFGKGIVTLTFEELSEEDPFSVMLKEKLTEIIRWAEKENPRNKQVSIGPSEIGDPCDRRIGYRIARISPVNTDFDIWPATVGTAVHSWLEAAVTAWGAKHNDRSWKVEQTLAIKEWSKGHSDLYSVEHQAVIDWKTAGPDLMRKYRKEGPPRGYQIQAQIYGYGFEELGYEVRKVALAFLPRAGWLRDMYVWSENYNRVTAILALNRVVQIADRLVSMDILNQSHRWEQVPATPSNSCGMCPMYDPSRDGPATDTGCPGNKRTDQE